jgi:hypothetical protein
MEPRVLSTTTTTLRRKRGRKPKFDPTQGWLARRIRHFDAVVYSELVCFAATHGLHVEQALNQGLRAGLKAVREGR